MAPKNLIGLKTKFLEVLQLDTTYDHRHHTKKRTRWLCKCVCGKVISVIADSLVKTNPQQSCGCILKTLLADKTRKHDGRKDRKFTPAYKSWSLAKNRCFNEKSTQYKWYGAKGITMCSRWKNDFRLFLEDMGERPVGTTLDRINPLGNYEPNNCRWADVKTQMTNRSNAISIHHPDFGNITIGDLSEKTGIKYIKLYHEYVTKPKKRRIL